MRRTSARSGGTSALSMSSQLPLAWWLEISARSAAVQPARSRLSACFRVFGSAVDGDTVKVQPEPRFKREAFRSREARAVKRTAGSRLRSGYAPRPRLKCSCCDDGALDSSGMVRSPGSPSLSAGGIAGSLPAVSGVGVVT
eukprot:4472352-Pleurochrysis_carterae.AAC.2